MNKYKHTQKVNEKWLKISYNFKNDTMMILLLLHLLLTFDAILSSVYMLNEKVLLLNFLNRGSFEKSSVHTFRYGITPVMAQCLKIGSMTGCPIVAHAK